MKSLFTIFCLLIGSNSWAVGFSQGNAIVQRNISGHINVTCSNGGQISQASSYCDGIVSDPDSTDYFVGPEGVSADNVTLLATRADGSTISKSANYDSAQGRSAKRFNLLIRTLLQKPLLKQGMNKVSYSLTAGSQVKSSGDFNVNVSMGPDITCQSRYFNSFDENDCRIPSNLCQRYFDEAQCN